MSGWIECVLPCGDIWWMKATEVTAGLAESNGSLLPGGWLKVTCGLTACTLGSAPAQRSVTSMEKLYLYELHGRQLHGWRQRIHKYILAMSASILCVWSFGLALFGLTEIAGHEIASSEIEGLENVPSVTAARSVLKWRETDRQTDRQTDTQTDTEP